jgi:hypothetical protein
LSTAFSGHNDVISSPEEVNMKAKRMPEENVEGQAIPPKML